MKCKKCGQDLFNGQFACHKCGHIVEKAAPKPEVKEEPKAKEKK